MASPVMRISRSVSRSWFSAFAGISRSLVASSNTMQSRAYSGEVHKGTFPVSSAHESEDHQPDPSPSFESSGTSLSDGFPVSGNTPVGQAVGEEKPNYYRREYTPKKFQTPRGVFKVILVGEVGQLPVQKILKSGKSVTIFSVGTGGMYNNRRPFEGESPQEFAERSYTQWHRVAVYQDRIAGWVMQHIKAGSNVYLEGNLESRIYNDPNSGGVKRIREVAIRSNGSLMFMPESHPQPPVRVRDESFNVPPS